MNRRNFLLGIAAAPLAPKALDPREQLPIKIAIHNGVFDPREKSNYWTEFVASYRRGEADKWHTVELPQP